MKYPKLIGFFSIIIIITAFTACKKSSSISIGNSRLVLINYYNSYGNNMYYRVVYGVGNNVDSIVYTGGGTDTGNNGYVTFNYVNSSYTINNNGNTSEQVDINTDLRIDTLFNSGSETAYFQYNGTQLAAINYLNSGSISTVDYTYSNGNITAINAMGSANTYDYDESKSGQIGDPGQITEFLTYGRAYSISAHLATDCYVNGTLQQLYTYQIDSYGRITQLTAVIKNTGGANDTIRYAYFYNL